MDIVQRVPAILLKPKDEWVKIKAEPATVGRALHVLRHDPGRHPGRLPVPRQHPGRPTPARVGLYRWPVGRALGNAVVAYVLSLATVYLFALIINELAPNFGSAKNMTSALKLAVYSMTPGWVAGVLYIIPGLWILGVLASLYGLYILYLGFDTPMMETPKDKVGGYLGGQHRRRDRALRRRQLVPQGDLRRPLRPALIASGQLLDDPEEGLVRGRGAGDGAPDDEIIRSLGHGLGRGHDPLLVLGGRPDGPDARRDDGQLPPVFLAQDLDLLGRADDPVQARGLGQAGQAEDLGGDVGRPGPPPRDRRP